MSRQLKIDVTNGMFFVSDNIISNRVSEQGLINKPVTNLIVGKYVFDLIAYYKNGKLDHTVLTLTNSYLRENKVTETTDMKEYINLWTLETGNMISQLIETEKRKFNWGKINIKTDPRNPTVFAEFKFIK